MDVFCYHITFPRLARFFLVKRSFYPDFPFCCASSALRFRSVCIIFPFCTLFAQRLVPFVSLFLASYVPGVFNPSVEFCRRVERFIRRFRCVRSVARLVVHSLPDFSVPSVSFSIASFIPRSASLLGPLPFPLGVLPPCLLLSFAGYLCTRRTPSFFCSLLANRHTRIQFNPFVLFRVHVNEVLW